MKKFIILLVIMAFSLSGYEVCAQQQNQHTTKQERREERTQKRAARQLAFEQHIDSMVNAGYFQFIPRSMQRSVGPTVPISNPDFSLEYQDGRFDIYLPYIEGSMPPYRVSVLNYVTSNVENYTTQKTDNGWTVAFVSTLFDGSIYTFTLEIYTKTGGANLTVERAFNTTVQYSGIIFQI